MVPELFEIYFCNICCLLDLSDYYRSSINVWSHVQCVCVSAWDRCVIDYTLIKDKTKFKYISEFKHYFTNQFYNVVLNPMLIEWVGSKSIGSRLSYILIVLRFEKLRLRGLWRVRCNSDWVSRFEVD